MQEQVQVLVAAVGVRTDWPLCEDYVSVPVRHRPSADPNLSRNRNPHRRCLTNRP